MFETITVGFENNGETEVDENILEEGILDLDIATVLDDDGNCSVNENILLNNDATMAAIDEIKLVNDNLE